MNNDDKCSPFKNAAIYKRINILTGCYVNLYQILFDRPLFYHAIENFQANLLMIYLMRFGVDMYFATGNLFSDFILKV
jgi:hypothetical protein